MKKNEELSMYTLMHKNIPVLDMGVTEHDGNIRKIFKVHQGEHLPVGTKSLQNQGVANPDRIYLNNWWRGRSIPASRNGIFHLLNSMSIPDPILLLTKSFGLSLSDHYWIKPMNQKIKWEDINFFDHDFSEDLGSLLFGKTISKDKGLNVISPDASSDGVLKKKWKISDGQRLLIKGGSDPFCQEPFNEVMATLILKHLHIPHVTYGLLKEEGNYYSVCPNFITKETELIPAIKVAQTHKQRGSESNYEHLLLCCENLGIRHIHESLEQMIVIDFLIANTDRHWNNFGFLRNPDSLEWLGMAPIFDSGTSLWHNKSIGNIGVGEEESKCFKKLNKDQLTLLTDLTWLDGKKLQSLPDILKNAIMDFPEGEQERWKVIVSAIEKRCLKMVDFMSRR